MKHIVSAAVFLCGFFSSCALAGTALSAVPEPFQRFDSTSDYKINYDDLSDLLRTVVVDVGLSKRELAELPKAKTGTRMKFKVQRLTAHEGNRFFFEAFQNNDASKQYLREIQNSLEKVPDEIPLESFSRDVQLAYWLNLYNVTVLNEIIAVYPRRNLKRLLQGKNSILSKKLLKVAGIPLSLDDIQFVILKQNYDSDPLILYGLYQGIVGGPNIRKSAYTGDDVYRALEDNADKFINSNRGTFSRSDEDFIRVSGFYDRNREYFPQFSSDLSQHLLAYLREGDERTRLQVVSKIEPDIEDWTVTDLGGNRHAIGGSFADNDAALLDAYKGRRRSDGGILVAPVEVKRPEKEKEDEEEDDAVPVGDLDEFPRLPGSSPEEITTPEVVEPD